MNITIDPVKAAALNDKLNASIYNVQAYNEAYSIGMYVVWHNRKHVICNRFLNGTLIISPMGNGSASHVPAKYYTVNETDVQITNESITVVS